MALGLLLGRLVLTAVFLVAAVGKLRDPDGSRKAVAEFGVPAPLAAAVARLLPWAELGVALALLPARTAVWGAVGSLVLLVGFLIGIAVSLARGRRPACHCFGQLSSGPIGWTTVARNLVLAAVALAVAWQGPGPSLLAAPVGFTTAERWLLVGGLVALVLIVVEGFVLVQVMAQNGRLLQRLEAVEALLGEHAPGHDHDAPPQRAGLPIGAPAPRFALPGLDGRTVRLQELQRGENPLLLLFLDPGCGPCGELLPEVGRWEQAAGARVALAVMSRGTAAENRPLAAAHGIRRVLLQGEQDVAGAYRVSGTPAAVLVQADGTIGSPAALGVDEVRALVEGVIAGSYVPSAPRQGLPMGSPAPALRLPDVAGTTRDLGEFRGSKTLLLFWSPDCGFCQQMLPELKAWEGTRPADAPRLLLVSTGSAEANRAQGLTSPLLLDADFSTSAGFGVNGTPSAVLVDAEGRIASQVGEGQDDVWDLLGGRPGRNGAASRR